MFEARKALLVLATLSIGGLVSCSGAEEVSSGPGAPDSAPSAEAPFVVGTGFTPSAAQGDELVVANRGWLSDPKSTPFARANSKMEWTALPAPPEHFTNVAMASLDDRPILAGLSCDQDPCEAGSVSFFALEGDAWRPFGEKLPFSDGSDEMSALPGRNRFALISTPAGRVAIDSSLDVRLLPDSPDETRGGSSSCLVDSTLVVSRSSFENSVGAEGTGAVTFTVSGMESLDLADKESTWQQRKLPPENPPSAFGGVCTTTGLLFVGDGTELAYDAASDTWGPRVGVPFSDSVNPAPGSWVIGPTGSTFVIGSEGATLRRSPSGDWSEVGRGDVGLFVTSSAVYAAELNQTTLTPLEDQ